MSEPPHQVEYDFDYWMNADLMDACFDPMHDGMGLKSRATSTNTGVPPITTELQTTGFDYGLMSWDDGTHFDNGGESASMTAVQDVAAAETQGVDKFEHACLICGDNYKYRLRLEYHANATGHRTFPCSLPGCDQSFAFMREREVHEKLPHTRGHGRTATPTSFDCVECGASLASKANLIRHAKERQHQPYSCTCGAAFSRLDVLNRHLESLGTETPRFPCKLCKRHRGANGFRRQDHLRQHERNYHHLEMDDASTQALASRLKYYFPVCTHSDCPYYREDSFQTLPRSSQNATKPFPTQGAFTKHMREEHNECTFPCDIQGCDRVGRRGYFREKDMIKHRKQSHPDVPPYQPSEREVQIRCTEPGCAALLMPSSMLYHVCRNNCPGNATNQPSEDSFSSDAVQMQPMANGSDDLYFGWGFDDESSGF